MFGPTESSRKYVDLINKISSQWANWTPSVPIEVGDYGQINRKTGLFEKEGNIYKDEAICHVVKGYPPQKAAKEDTTVLVSDSGRRRAVESNINLGIPGYAQVSLQGQWEFCKKRGALLIMDRPQVSYISNDIVFKHLTPIPALADKVLVTDVTVCHAYWLYLSTKDGDVVSLALLAKTPVADGTVSGDVRWWNESVSGILRKGCTELYSPLFSLKKIAKKSHTLFRDGPAIHPPDDNPWVDVLPPWDALDEDGNEVPFEDTIFYAEDEEVPVRETDSLEATL